MKLLYIIPSFQHPNVRGPNRHYHLVRELSRRHAITLLIMNRSEVGTEALDEVSSYVEQLHLVDICRGGSPVSRWLSRLPVVGRRLAPILQLRRGIREMQAVLRQLMATTKYDLIVFHGKSLFPVIDQCQDIPIVVDFCDATSMRVRNKMRIASFVERPFLWLRYADIRRVERGLLNKTPHVAFIAPRDRDAILGPGGQAEILPNGVDHQFWHRRAAPSNRNCIAFSGVMDYGPNNDAALHLIDNIAPLIRQTIPDLEVLIVGRNPSAELRDRGARTPNITVTGFVDDVRPHLERAAVFAAPLRYASGTQNKVLEAMSMEVPAITTATVADGLRMNDSEEPPVVVADDDTEFASRLVRLLQDQPERSRLAARGRKYVEDHFVWSRSADKLERMCLAAVGRQESQP